MNYLITNHNFCDFLYQLPFTFLWTEEDLMESVGRYRNEIKLTADYFVYLGIVYKNQINLAYTFLDIYYGSVLSTFKPEDITANVVFIEHWMPRFDGTTLFHAYALIPRVL